MSGMSKILLLACLLSCKPRGPATQPDKPPLPLLEGKCRAEVMSYQGNGWWTGQNVCEYQGWIWYCPTGSPESSRVCNRGPQLPAEKQ